MSRPYGILLTKNAKSGPTITAMRAIASRFMASSGATAAAATIARRSRRSPTIAAANATLARSGPRPSRTITTKRGFTMPKKIDRNFAVAPSVEKLAEMHRTLKRIPTATICDEAVG